MFACIFIPDFSVQAIIRFEPELRARSIAVLTGRSPLENVSALNERARQSGVEVGATKSQLEAWDNLVLRARSESQETSAHAALLDCAQSFSPEIEDASPGTVLLNLAGLEPLFGPLPKIARDLARRVSQMRLEANIAVAPNPDAALLAARGFPGVTLIPEGREAERLGDLPVDVLLESFSSDLEEAARWVETFDRWGIRKLRALATLPEVPLSERLGQPGVRLQKLARGAASRNLSVLEPRLIFAESVELEYPIVLLEPLAFLLNRMLEQVCARLGARALAVQELQLNLELAATQQNGCASFTCTPSRKFTRTLRLPTPMLDQKIFLKLLQLDLQAHPPGAPIVKIHLSADPACPRALQSGLFQPVFPEPEKLELTLARIAGIVGEGRVGSVELLDTHREGAFTMRHFVPAELAPAEHRSKQSGNRKKDMSMQENGSVCPFEEKPEEDAKENAKEQMSAVIALRLFRPPLGASVTLREAKPVRMRCLQREDIAGEIVWTAGPWRSSGDWSEQEGWSREEWDIAVPADNALVLYRLVQDKLSGNWFVEGTYD
ncbi:MAG TPA: DNA polymerase Y family protein [Terriglobales bacterium]|nr:DNA polymerase Y family protein [Terriglobales bacterium]